MYVFLIPFFFNLLWLSYVQGIIVKEFSGKPYWHALDAILLMLSGEDKADDKKNFSNTQILESFRDILPAYIDKLASSVVSGYYFYKHT